MGSFPTSSLNISKTVADTAKVTINQDRNWTSYIGFPLTPRSMTLNDLALL